MIRFHAVIALGLALAATAVAAAVPHDAGKGQGARPVAGASARGLPDWSGQWQIEGLTPDATGGFDQSLEEALKPMLRWGPPPYNAAVRPLVDKAMTMRGPPGGATTACAFGYPQIMLASPLMFEALATPKETVLIFSAREVRHVYTDGRPHTSKEDLWPTFWGDSIGRWEGQTLVIDTIAVLSAMAPADMPVIPILAMGGKGPDAFPLALLSRQAHFVERLRMVGDRLEDQMTITDPVMLSAPWHVIRTYNRVPNVHRMIYEDCSGVDRNPIVNGQFTLTPAPAASPPPPPEMAPLLEVLAKAAN